MRYRSRRVQAACLIAITMLLAACGQRPGVQGSGRGGPAGNVAAVGQGAPGGGVGLPGEQGVGGSDTARTGNEFTTGRGRDEISQDGSPATRGGTAPGQSQSASGGIDDKEIRVGQHGPRTGAAPIPSEATQADKYYWQYRGKVRGRSIRTFFADDEYRPSSGARACQRLIEEDDVFVIVGISHPDVMRACARVAARAGVPYLAQGMTEEGFQNLPNFLAFSMTFRQQAVLLADVVDTKLRPSNGRVGILHDNRPGNKVGIQAAEQVLRQRGYTVLKRQEQNGPSDAQWLFTNQIQTATAIMSPLDWIEVVRSPGAENTKWVSYHLLIGADIIAVPACSGSGADGSYALSFWPGVNLADQVEPAFARYGDPDSPTRDLDLAQWGMMKTVDMVFSKMGASFTQLEFSRTARTMTVRSGVYPNLQPRPDNPFGALDAHLLQMDCSRGDRPWFSRPEWLFRKRFK